MKNIQNQVFPFSLCQGSLVERKPAQKQAVFLFILDRHSHSMTALQHCGALGWYIVALVHRYVLKYRPSHLFPFKVPTVWCIHRAVGRFENTGVPVYLPFLVEIGLTDLPKSETPLIHNLFLTIIFL